MFIGVYMSKDKARKMLTKNVQEIAQALTAVKMPAKVLTDNISTGWVKVGKGNVVRLQVGADTYVAFDDDGVGAAVSATTSPAVKLDAGYHYVVCQGEYIRASANATRIELHEL